MSRSIPVERNWYESMPRKSSFDSEMSSDSTPPSSPQSSENASPSSILSACDFILDIKNYVPAGCLRLERYKCQLTPEVWTACNTWQWLGHPREVAIPNTGPFLQNVLQETLFKNSFVQHCRNLHQAGWIRLEFKMRDEDWGQVRVYILPEDTGRRMIDRADHVLRKSLQRLMAELDTARATWDSEWPQDAPILHIGAIVDGRAESDISLFQLFNTLPSPSPDCDVVRDPYAKTAMSRLLSGDIEGLKTTMLAYQRRSAATMLQKEAQPGQIVDPRLLKVADLDGVNWFCDVNTGTCLRTPRMYEATRGGICAETMGLGKTLICLALILATKELSSQIPAEYSVGTIPVRPRVGSLLEMSAATIGRTGTPWKGYFNQLEQDGSDYSECKDAIRRNAGFYMIPSPTPRRASRKPAFSPAKKVFLSAATLVVVPANLVRQWEREIDKHTTGLKVLVMRNNKQELPPASELAEYDVILFSRPRFEKESKDGTDESGRREASIKNASKCTCSNHIFHRALVMGEVCKCHTLPAVYHSSLRDLHFKRLITDEGHTMGNSSNSAKTNAVIVVDFLQLSARWIVSGTPTPGLYGADAMPMIEDINALESTDIALDTSSPISTTENIFEAEQERKDLEKLGNIATTYLKSRPWANARYDQNFASWSQYVMQPRHGNRSHGNMSCLRSTLEGMIIRHRPEDVEKDLDLPPLYQKVVYLEGSYQDKLSLNIFSLMITSNAVTSERKDADYLFHPRQRTALDQLAANLRQASFFWSGFKSADVESTINLAKSFLSKGELFTSDEDKHLLQKVIELGEIALLNPIWLAASEFHEMPLHVHNSWSPEVRMAWALDRKHHNPTLFGATQLFSLQKFIVTKLHKSGVTESVEDAGNAARANLQPSSPATPMSRSKTSKLQRKLDESLPALAGGLRVAADSSPKKKQPRKLSDIAIGVGSPKKAAVPVTPTKSKPGERSPENHQGVKNQELGKSTVSLAKPKDLGRLINAGASLSPQWNEDFSPVASSILSTASSKLSYLINEVVKYHKAEKIIIFYETDNIAYYIAQGLEVIGIEHLIYAKSLSSDRRSSYVVTFNQVPRFRVLLMDISQAAFGLDISSASRVYFVNPVLNKQIEAQAVKRAHRIGQWKPVYVETLVLRDSIEEVIIERRKAMSSDEQKRCKTVLDDETMYDWIKNVRFVPLTKDEISDPEQMARLFKPQPAFRNRKGAESAMHDPDAGLVLDFSPEGSRKRKGKRATSFEENNEDDEEIGNVIVVKPFSSQSPTKKRRKNATFLVDDVDEQQPNSPGSPFIPGLSPFSPFTASSPFESGPGSPVAKQESPSKAQRSRLDKKGMMSLLKKLRSDKQPRGGPEDGSGSGYDPSYGTSMT